MPIVNYGSYRVGDQRLRDVLERIADETSRVVRVTSGDRDFVPRGGAPDSLHLVNQAVDFHIDGLTDEQAFNLLRLKRSEIFGDGTGDSFRFQVIQHGSNTETQGPHIHLGIVPDGDRGKKRGFIVEGVTGSTRHRYITVDLP